MMSHRVMMHSVNLNRGKNDQWNTHLTNKNCDLHIVENFKWPARKFFVFYSV